MAAETTAAPVALRLPAGAPARTVVLAGGALVLVAAVLAWDVDERLGVLALGTPLALALAASPVLAACLLCFAMPLEELSTVVGGGIAMKAVGAAAIGSWLVNALVARRRIELPALGVPLLALVAWAAASALWAMEPGPSLRLSFTLGQLLALYFLVPNVLDTPGALRRALDLHVAGAVILAAFAVWLTHQGVLQEGRTAIVIGGEMLLESNALATALVLPLTLGLVASLDAGRGPAARLLLAGAAALCLTAIVLTMSRSALVAVALVAVAVSVARRSLLLPVAAAALAVPGLLLVGPEFWQRWVDAATLADRGAGRLDIWQVGWRVIESRPLTGVGLGNFPLVYYDYLAEAAGVSARHAAFVATHMQKYPHSIYLGTAAELGVVGVGLLAVALLAHLRAAWTAWRAFARRRPDAAPLALAVLAAVGALIVQGGALDILARKYLWLALGLAALLHLRRPRGRQA